MRSRKDFGLLNRDDEPKAYHYKECGLPNIFLRNGFRIEAYDGEEYVSIENIDGLWKAIGLNLVVEKKTLTPDEIRFIRHRMDYTQAELASLLRVGDQTVARWEKGETEMPGPADLSLRALFLNSDIAQPEGNGILAKWKDQVEKLLGDDSTVNVDLLFQVTAKVWKFDEYRIAV